LYICIYRSKYQHKTAVRTLNLYTYSETRARAGSEHSSALTSGAL